MRPIFIAIVAVFSLSGIAEAAPARPITYDSSGIVEVRRGGSSGGSHAVRGHTTRNGTYVAPSRATNPDSSRLNNYSARGNVNPSTGRVGTVDPARR